MIEIIEIILLCTGTFFVLTAAIGILRMPDVYLRVSVVTKAATLGVGLILAGLALHFSDFSITVRVLAILFFIFLTAPVAAHMIGRAAYFIGEPLWTRTVRDDLKKRYNKSTEQLASSMEQADENQKDAKVYMNQKPSQSRPAN
jgi:multicomponent Na+:H+ antiporter subunit G